MVATVSQSSVLPLVAAPWARARASSKSLARRRSDGKSSLHRGAVSENEYVLVGDQKHARDRTGALLLHLEEARSWHEIGAAEAAEQGNKPVMKLKACLRGELL